MIIDRDLFEVLVCPDCRGELSVDTDRHELVCVACGLAYPVRDGIPVMLVGEARATRTEG